MRNVAPLGLPGSATAWQHGALPASRAFVVELRPGDLGIREAGPYARAILRLLRAPFGETASAPR